MDAGVDKKATAAHTRRAISLLRTPATVPEWLRMLT
jgi:hypothetical protein